MKNKHILFSLLSFIFFNAQSKAQTSKLGFEFNTSYDGVFFTNQPSRYLATSVEKRLNASLDGLYSLSLVLPLKNPKNNLKIGLGYSDQDYSFDNNPPTFTFFVIGPSDDPEIIDDVYVRAGFITLPFAFEREIARKSDKRAVKLLVGLNTNFNISKSSEVSFNLGSVPLDPDNPFDREGYEAEITSYYLESVRKVTFKAYSSVGYDFLLAKKLHFLLDARVGLYLQSFNPRIMNVPIIVGLGAGLRYGL